MNELVHATVGTSMTQAEFEAVGLHVLNSQATGDLIYAPSAVVLQRLGIGSTSAFLQVVGGIPAWVTSPILADNQILKVGTDGDTVLVNRSTSLNANTTVTSVLIGTPVTAATPANSMMVSNVTASGDIAYFLNDTSGNSWEYMRFDGSAKGVIFNEASSDIDFRIESNGQANMFVIDAGLDVYSFGAVVNGSRFVNITPTITLLPNVPTMLFVGGTMTCGAGSTSAYIQRVNPTGVTTATEAQVYAVVASLGIDEPVITLGGGSSATIAASLYISGAPTEGVTNAAIWVGAGDLKFGGSVDSAAVADQVAIGGYEIGGGNRVFSLSQETAVAVDTDETKFSNKVQCRINGATYFIMLTAT